MNDKKTILFVADVRNWAFDNIAQYLVELLKDKYDCHIVYNEDFKDHEQFLHTLDNYAKIDFIHFFCRAYLGELIRAIGQKNYDNKYPPLVKFLNAATVTSIPDHLFIRASNEILNKLTIFEYVDNYYPVSKKLYDIYNNIAQYPKPKDVIYDNILVQNHQPSFSSNHEKLLIIWIGNSIWGETHFGKNYDYKGFNTVVIPAFNQLKEEGINFEEYVADSAKQRRSKQELHEALKKADILLISAKIEGTPLPLIEAIANGCAVISTDVGIVTEILPPIQKEFIVKNDPQEFVKAIKKLNANRALLEEIKKQNYAAYQRIFGNKGHFQNLWLSLIEDSITRLANDQRVAKKENILTAFNHINNKRRFFSFNSKDFLEKIKRNALIKKIVKYLLSYPVFKPVIRAIFMVVESITLKTNYTNFKELLINYSQLENNKEEKAADVYVVYTTRFPGVAYSTQQLFKKILPMPSFWFSEYAGLPNRLISKMAKLIIETKVQHLIISGGVRMEAQLVEKLHHIKGNNKINIYLLWHGSPAQWVDTHHYETYQQWLNFYQQGKIKAIITLKKDLEKVFNAYNIKSYLLQNFIPYQSQPLIPNIVANKFTIGIWSASNTWIKNLYPQLTAVGMLKEEVACFTNFSFNKNDSWLTENVELNNIQGNLPRQELMDLMANTDLTLYITNSECSPMIVLESLSLGVPCLVGPTSGVYDDDQYMREMLTIKRVDCPYSIYQAINKVRHNISEIKSRLPNFITEYNKNAQLLKNSLLQTIIDNQ